MTDTRPYEEQHADFIRMYLKSGGGPEDGERMWIKSQIDKSAPSMLLLLERVAARGGVNHWYFCQYTHGTGRPCDCGVQELNIEIRKMVVMLRPTAGATGAAS